MLQTAGGVKDAAMHQVSVPTRPQKVISDRLALC